MPLIQDSLFTAIDFESAGTDRGKTDSPVQVGLASWSMTSGNHNQFVSYLATDQAVQWNAQKVHGITNADLKDAPSLLSLWPDLKSRLGGAVVVAHGKGTEKRFLRAFPGHGFKPWVDTLLLARAIWPDLASHSLGKLCDSLHLSDKVRQLVPCKSWHDALFDAAASLVLLSHMIESMDLGPQPVELLLSPDISSWHQSRRS